MCEALIPSNMLFPKAFDTLHRNSLTETEKKSILSFIETQIEPLQLCYESNEVIQSHFLTLLKLKSDLNVLKSIVNGDCNLDECIKRYYKRIKVNAKMTINSVACLRNNKVSRDNSHVVVFQEVDQTPKETQTDMKIVKFYYRINFFFEFQFGSTSCILANVNELKPKQIIKSIDIIGKLIKYIYLLFRCRNERISDGHSRK